jgi:hypothetical protein
MIEIYASSRPQEIGDTEAVPKLSKYAFYHSERIRKLRKFGML